MGSRGAPHPRPSLRGHRWQDKLTELLSWGRAAEGPAVVGWAGAGAALTLTLRAVEGHQHVFGCKIQGGAHSHRCARV